MPSSSSGGSSSMCSPVASNAYGIMASSSTVSTRQSSPCAVSCSGRPWRRVHRPPRRSSSQKTPRLLPLAPRCVPSARPGTCSWSRRSCPTEGRGTCWFPCRSLTHPRGSQGRVSYVPGSPEVFQRRTGDVRLQRPLASWREVNAPRPPLGHAPHRSVQRGSKARTNARLPHPVCDKLPSAPTNPHNPRGFVQSLLSGMRSTALSHRPRRDPCALRIESSALSRSKSLTKMARKKRINQTMKAIVPSSRGAVQRISVDALAAIPEDEIWLASRKSARTRRAYRNDVAHFMRTLGIRSLDELRRVDHRAVMAWERLMREEEGSQASTVRRRLAALSSLFTHLVKFDVVDMNPVRDVERPVVNRREGMTLAFSQTQARAILDGCQYQT